MDIYRRLWPYLKPYRTKIVLAVGCGLAVALFWGLNLTATYPVMRTILSTESPAQTVATAVTAAEDELGALRGQAEKIERKPDVSEADRARAAETAADQIAEAETRLARLRWFQRVILPWLPGNRFLLLTAILVGILLLTLLKGIGQFVQDYVSWCFTEGVIRDLRRDLFAHSLRLDYANHSQRGTPELLSRFGFDLQQITVGLTVLGSRLIREPLKAGACLGFAFLLNWRLTLLSCVLLPLLGALFYVIGRRLRKASHRQMEAMEQLYGTLTETLDASKEVQLHDASRRQLGHLRADHDDYYRRAMKIAKWDSLTAPATESLGILAAFVALVPGAFLVLRQTTEFWGVELASRPIDIAELSTLYLLLIGALDSLRRLSSVYARIKRAAAATERVFEVLDEQPSVPDAAPTPQHTADADARSAQVAVENIRFAYPGESERPVVLDDVTLNIPAGQTVAIVGENGCGKSTLLHLLPRFYDPESGTVSFDGTRADARPVAELRQTLGLVQQDTFLFDTTIEENIRFSKPDATEQEVLDAAERAAVLEFLTGLPERLQTRVGPRGARLSGGQRQRVALARAILKDPPLLILDEATSAIDSRSETLILDSLRDFAAERTTLIVSHTLPDALLRLIDRTIVLRKGRVVGDGTHEELLISCVDYRRLFGPTVSSDAA